jgi:hypothetical protein
MGGTEGSAGQRHWVSCVTKRGMHNRHTVDIFMRHTNEAWPGQRSRGQALVCRDTLVAADGVCCDYSIRLWTVQQLLPGLLCASKRCTATQSLSAHAHTSDVQKQPCFLTALMSSFSPATRHISLLALPGFLGETWTAAATAATQDTCD